MTQMLWEKAIRWYMSGHASFLAMTAFAVSYKTLAQIPKYPPGSFSNFVISQQPQYLGALGCLCFKTWTNEYCLYK